MFVQWTDTVIIYGNTSIGFEKREVILIPSAMHDNINQNHLPVLKNYRTILMDTLNLREIQEKFLNVISLDQEHRGK